MPNIEQTSQDDVYNLNNNNNNVAPEQNRNIATAPSGQRKSPAVITPGLNYIPVLPVNHRELVAQGPTVEEIKVAYEKQDGFFHHWRTNR